MVAERGSFAAVARATDRDPSSVSRTIAALERDLGTRLFQRSTRRLRLTEAGAGFVQRIGPVLAEIDRAREALRATEAEPSGTLRLTCSVAFGQECIVPLLGRLRADCPALRIELLQTDANLDLVGDGIDLAVRLAPAPRGDLVSTRLMRTRYRVVASPDYLGRAGRPAGPDDLAGHRCLMLGLAGFPSRWRFRDRSGAVSERDVDGDVTISNPLGLRRAAEAGLGPALIADWLVARPLEEGGLVDLFPGHEATATTFHTGAWAHYPSRAFLPAKVRRTMDFLRRALARS